MELEHEPHYGSARLWWRQRVGAVLLETDTSLFLMQSRLSIGLKQFNCFIGSHLVPGACRHGLRFHRICNLQSGSSSNLRLCASSRVHNSGWMPLPGASVRLGDTRPFWNAPGSAGGIDARMLPRPSCPRRENGTTIRRAKAGAVFSRLTSAKAPHRDPEPSAPADQKGYGARCVHGPARARPSGQPGPPAG